MLSICIWHNKNYKEIFFQGSPVPFGRTGTIFGLQDPVLQELVAVHTWLQVPQLVLSSLRFTHLPLQQANAGDWQTFPQAPQFSLSALVLMHSPLQ
jgi:hypothetical protein